MPAGANGSSSDKFALDTSVLVPLLSEWHDNHLAALREVNARRARGQTAIAPVHAVLECFSVLTRLPAPLRAPAATVRKAITEWFPAAFIANLDSRDALEAMQDVANAGAAGGRVYDAAIARSAWRAGARTLLTYNVRDFAHVAPAGMNVREP